jgi:DNA mismatch endonuclease, patch repair protein
MTDGLERGAIPQDSAQGLPPASADPISPAVKPPRVPSDPGYPVPSSAAASAVMRGNRRLDTRPELALRRLLHGRGLRYRVDFALSIGGVKTRPDIVFSRQRVAVYVDGCFWHACPEHGNQPRANAGYWEAKLRRNVERDRRATQALEAAGWVVIRAWEHELPSDVAARVAYAVRTPNRPSHTLDERENARTTPQRVGPRGAEASGIHSADR